ncbi:gas vesicle structural protein GvpA [Streptomyces sp. NPDC048639]|uniref:gas vesicle structural protein GvpA n=1 Tax=Streptomyces sp. NPDC048639 TaxID=3365581 RepID=UPI003711DCE3
MTVMQQSRSTPATTGSGGGTSGLYDVLELILDRGLVIDAFVRVSLVGIEILKIDVRVVVASVDTYLRFAEACNRLDLESGRKAPSQLTDLTGQLTESGAKGKSKGALTGAVEAITDSLQGGKDSEEEERPARRTTKSSSSRRTPRRKEEDA